MYGFFVCFFKVQSATSCHSCACANSNSWDKADEDDIKLVNIPVTTPENLYLMGKS